MRRRGNSAVKESLTSISPPLKEHILYIPTQKDSTVLRAMKGAAKQVEDAGSKAMHAVEKAGRRRSLMGGAANKGKEKGKRGRKSTVEAEDEWFKADEGAEEFLTRNEVVENGEVYGQLYLSFFPIEY